MILYHALKYLLSPPHPDKVPNTMPHDLPSPSKLLHPILDKYSFDDSIAHAISMLKERLKFDVHTLRDLEAMNVTDVGQYRSEKVMHEHIVIQYAYQPNETQPPLPVDTRVGRFERYKCSSNKSDKLDSSPLVKEIIQASMNQVKLDNVRISNKVEMDSANVGVVQSHYCLLRSFAPLFGSLNFLQVLAIANAVSSVASEYSSLHHMCLWFATTFYLSIKKFISFDGRENISKGIISRLGMFRNVTLVNRDSGALTFGSTGTLGNLYANHFAQGVSRKDLEDLRKVIERDEILLRKEGNLQLLQVSSIVTAARLQQDLLYGFFRDQSQAVKDRLEEEEREREADRRRLEVAEAGQVAEHKRAEDEHKRAEDEHKRAEDERKRAEDERKHAEDERKRADAAEAGQADERRQAAAERKRAEAALAEIATLRLLLENQKK